MILNEGGNVFDNTSNVAKDDVAKVVGAVKRDLPSALQTQVMAVTTFYLLQHLSTV
jgi:hypothetical protein